MHCPISLGLCNNITSQIVAGPVMLEIADRYHLSHYRIANFSDAVQAMFSYTMPWGGPALTMCATSLIANSAYGWCPVLTSPAKLFFCGIYGIAIGLVFLVCAITGIGRKFDQRMDIKNLGYTRNISIPWNKNRSFFTSSRRRASPCGMSSSYSVFFISYAIMLLYERKDLLKHRRKINLNFTVEP